MPGAVARDPLLWVVDRDRELVARGVALGAAESSSSTDSASDSD